MTQSVKPQRAHRQHDLSRRSVLIVDDDAAAADVLSLRLTRQGFRTRVLECGAAALEAAERDQPDLILLDLRLPDLTGFEVCERLVDDESTSEIPVIILSGMEQPDIIRRCRAAGCKFFLHKPYDPNALLALIEQTLSESQG